MRSLSLILLSCVLGLVFTRPGLTQAEDDLWKGFMNEPEYITGPVQDIEVYTIRWVQPSGQLVGLPCYGIEQTSEMMRQFTSKGAKPYFVYLGNQQLQFMWRKGTNPQVSGSWRTVTQLPQTLPSQSRGYSIQWYQESGQLVGYACQSSESASQAFLHFWQFGVAPKIVRL